MWINSFSDSEMPINIMNWELELVIKSESVFKSILNKFQTLKNVWQHAV